MDEDQKKRVASFRFSVISNFFARDHMECGERERLLRDKCAQRWQSPFSNRTRLSRSTIMRWVQTLPPRRRQAGIPLPHGQK
ncbi:hypothetical protein DFAR_670012 [Desulfarculales bacterium]